jgi:hypothetical protein
MSIETAVSSSSIIDKFGQYTGIATDFQSATFGIFGDPGVEYGTLQQRVIASKGESVTNDGKIEIQKPDGWNLENGWGGKYGLQAPSNLVPVGGAEGYQVSPAGVFVTGNIAYLEYVSNGNRGTPYLFQVNRTSPELPDNRGHR